jgi:hypothetical protein
MSTERPQNNVWQELRQDELEQVCGGRIVARNYDAIGESGPTDDSVADAFEQQDTDVIRVWAL